MDRLFSWKPLSLSLLSTSPKDFINHNIFFPDLLYTVSQYFMTLGLMAVRQVVDNFESSVVVLHRNSTVARRVTKVTS